MARIDALSEGAKSLLQKGSVAGREFGKDLIKEVANLPEEELLTHLSALKDSELLYERGIYPQSTYVFKHALTQDVAYNSLLLKRRKEIHEKIGRAIEEIYPERMEEFYEMLAHHYSKSDNPEKAFQFLKLSGNKTTRSHSLWEALSFYRQAIEKLKELPETEENKRGQIEVIKLMEMPMRLLGYPEDSLNVILQGEKLSKALRDSQAMAVFSALIGLYYTHAGDAEQAKKYLENCVEQIENVQDINLIAPIAFDLGVSYLIKGEWSKAIDLFPKVIALIEKTNTEKEFFGKPSNCYAMFHVWYGFWVGTLGEFTEGKRWLDKGLSLALALDHPYTIGMSEFIYGWFFSMKGDGENCIMHIRNGIMNLEKAKAHIYLHLAWNISGLGHYLLGDLDTCFKHIEKGIEIQRELDMAFLLSFHEAHLSMAYLEARDIKNAKNCADVALNSSQDNNEKYFEALSRILLGHSIVKSDRSRLNEGKEHILRAIKMLDELKIKSISAVGFYFLGQTYADVGQKDMAKKSFKKAEVAFRKMGMDYWLARTREGFNL
jgi:tetratricopeptide (TPR) repeat protein